MAEVEIRALNTLAFPKGKHPRCDLTGVPATVQLETPQVTLYYATREHAEQAWHGIINKIAPLLGPLRSQAGMIGSEEDRAKREYTLNMSKRALVDLCSQEAAQFLADGRYALAIPGAIQAITFLKDLFGEGAGELIPPYLLLAEANLGLGRFQQAEEFLSLANWSVLKSSGCPNAVRSQLHRNFGKLYSAQGKHAEALGELTKDVYWSSLEFGPEHVNTSAGYYHMASIFYAQHRIENALALYDKVVDIWYKFLIAATGRPPQDSTEAHLDLAATLAPTQLTEAHDMLGFILQTRAKLLGQGHIATGEARYTLGLVLLLQGKAAEAQECVGGAAEVYAKHLGAEHQATRRAMAVLKQLTSRPENDLN